MTARNDKHYPTIAFIPARGGSKGVPRKALSMLGDRPLIAYTIGDALSIPGADKVFVSTDDPEIREVSIQYGAEVPFLRPPELAQDHSDLGDAVSYSLGWYREHEAFVPQVFIIMSPTYPFRRPHLVGDALQLGLDNPRTFNIGSLALARTIWKNWWTKTAFGTVPYQFPMHPCPERPDLYQSAFSFNIVYEFRAHFPNRRVPVVLTELEAIDIDEPQDLEIARMVIEEGLYPFHEQH